MRWTVRVTGPVATNSKVKDNEEVMTFIEWPVTTSLSLGNGVIVVTINEEFDVIWLPVNSIGVEVIAVTLRVLVCSSSVVWVSMKRGVDASRISSNEFHDVDLSASGPSFFTDVLTEKPESGPDALTLR
jgi:hypothetical protein